MRALHVPTVVHGRCLMDVPETPSALLVGFHGYGELAENAMEALRRLREERSWALLAIQALHPFYRRDGRVVAGWMTRQDRDLAIDDNVAYVGRALAAARRELGPLPVAFCGFSQGVAMTYRAAVGAGVASRALVALAGDVPPELHDRELDALPPVLIGRGSREEWYSEEKLAHDLDVLARHGVPTEVCRFDGGHEWDDAFVTAARQFLVDKL